MKRIYAIALICTGALLADACGVKRRGGGSHLAADSGTCEINPKDIQDRCDSPSIDSRAAGEAEQHFYGDVKNIQVNQDGTGHVRIEMGLVIGYGGAAPRLGQGLTRDTYDYFGGPELGRLPSARPEIREAREPFNGGINELKTQNRQDQQSVDARLSSDTKRFEMARAGLADATSEATIAHNTAATSFPTDALDTGDESAWSYQTPRDSAAGRRLEQARNYRNHVAQEVAKDTSENRQVREDLVEMADTALDLADDQYYGKSEHSGDFYLDIGLEILDISLSFVPVVGNAYDAVQVLTGYGIAGRLSDSERAIIAATLFIPVAKVGAVPKVMRLLERVGHSRKTTALLGRLLVHAEPHVDAAAKWGVPIRKLQAFAKVAKGMATHPKGFKMERIAVGSNPNVVVVIGRNMDGNVKLTAEHLRKTTSFEVRTFEPSEAAETAFKRTVAEKRELTRNPNARLSQEEMKETLVYKENVGFIESQKSDNVTFVDMGDPLKMSATEGPSVSYNMEVSGIFGDKK